MRRSDAMGAGVKCRAVAACASAQRSCPATAMAACAKTKRFRSSPLAKRGLTSTRSSSHSSPLIADERIDRRDGDPDLGSCVTKRVVADPLPATSGFKRCFGT